MRVVPVILSGGVGSRLWPLSRAATPKQLLALVGPETMIQATALRTADAARFSAPIVVAGAAHEGKILEQLAAVGRDPEALIVEPQGRNTAPAIALAALWLEAAGQGAAVMLAMPSDHVVGDLAAFVRAVGAGAPAAGAGWLVTFGIAARSPETGYGYIELGDALMDGVRRAVRFVEKPPLADAQAFVAGGNHAWNGGIFLLRADRYLDELREHAPEILAHARAAMADAGVEGPVVRPAAEAFARCPSESVDVAVMERASRVAVVPVEMGWSDIGNWDALFEAGARDDDGNALSGDVLAFGTRDCLARSDGPLVALVGCEGLSVIATGDAVLVVGRGHGQDVKRVVDALKARGAELL